MAQKNKLTPRVKSHFPLDTAPVPLRLVANLGRRLNLSAGLDLFVLNFLSAMKTETTLLYGATESTVCVDAHLNEKTLTRYSFSSL